MSKPSTSVLVASCRPRAVIRCLESLASQTTKPDEVIVAWQADDTATRDAATQSATRRDLNVKVIHSPEIGVVPAENTALARAAGDVLLLLDDDAVAPPGWLARHLLHYQDPKVGAVGGPFTNYNPDGTPFPKRRAEPVGRITWYGKPIGNIYDHDPAWRFRRPVEVDHVAGGNMSLRRAAFGRFECRLKPYWQFFEMDACLQVRTRGYRILFDFANLIDHYPTSNTFVANREGDLTVKVYNSAYNQAFVLGKHLRGWRRVACLGHLLGVGSVGSPGLLAFIVAAWRFGKPWRELRILRHTLCARLDGWWGGSRERGTVPPGFGPARPVDAGPEPFPSSEREQTLPHASIPR